MKKVRLTNILLIISFILIMIAMLAFIIFRIADITFLLGLCSPLSTLVSLIGIIVSLFTDKDRDLIWKQNLFLFIVIFIASCIYNVAMWQAIAVIYNELNTLTIIFM